MASLTPVEQRELDKLEFLTLEGVDHLEMRIVQVVGKFFPAVAFGRKKLQSYILKKLDSAALDQSGFILVYFHTEAERGVNNLRWLYEILPTELKSALKSIYFVHPGLQSRLVLGTLGWLLSERCYSKVKYIDRIEFLWEHVDPEQIQVPDFAWDHDDHLEHRPLGFESDNMPYVGHPFSVSC